MENNCSKCKDGFDVLDCKGHTLTPPKDKQAEDMMYSLTPELERPTPPYQH